MLRGAPRGGEPEECARELRGRLSQVGAAATQAQFCGNFLIALPNLAPSRQASFWLPLRAARLCIELLLEYLSKEEIIVFSLPFGAQGWPVGLTQSLGRLCVAPLSCCRRCLSPAPWRLRCARKEGEPRLSRAEMKDGRHFALGARHLSLAGERSLTFNRTHY